MLTLGRNFFQLHALLFGSFFALCGRKICHAGTTSPSRKPSTAKGNKKPTKIVDTPKADGQTRKHTRVNTDDKGCEIAMQLSARITSQHRLINYRIRKPKKNVSHLKKLICKRTLRQVFLRVYRLKVQSVMLVRYF